MPNDLKNRKLMPLNQTARSDTLVHGNPVTTRADATVENTFPGLEFDHRNLEKQFLDGLLFELHAGSEGGCATMTAAAVFLSPRPTTKPG